MWIKIDDTLPDHPKVYDLADRLKIDLDAAVGKMVRLWTWMITNRPEGRFTRLDAMRVPEVMRCNIKADKLLSALIGAGLVDKLENEYTIHDWDVYAGALLEQRRKNKERVTRCRKKQESIITETAESTDCNGYSNVTESITVAPENGACNGARVRVRERNIKDDDDDGSRAREANVDYSIIRLRAAEHYRASWGREPTEAELDAAVRWYCLGSPEELIWEAYRRAAQTNAKSAFAYASACLDEWERKGIKSIADLTTADFEREKHG